MTAKQIKTLESLKTRELKDKLHSLTGAEVKSNNRPYLIRRITAWLEQQTEAPRPPRAPSKPKPKRKAAPKANAKSKRTASARPRSKATPKTAGGRKADPRIPKAGTVLEREYQGKTVRVKVLDEGFQYKRKTYRSLSAIAREVTGTQWNGLLFFHLIPYKRRAASGEA